MSLLAGTVRAQESDEPEAVDEHEVVEPPPPREVIPGLYPEATGRFYGGQGLWVGTPDRSFTLRASGFAHFDTRLATRGDADNLEANVFWRRVRVTVDGRLFGQLEYRLMYDFVFDPIIPYDFTLDWRPIPELNVRVGGFKSAFGFERRARSYGLFFIERGWPSSLSPNRDLGAFVYGQTRDGFFSYDVAVVAGAENLAVQYGFRSGPPDLAGRVYVQPFRLVDGVPELRHLGIGLSWTVGEEIGAVGDTRITNVRASPRRNGYGGRLLFAHRNDATGTVVAHGRRDRQSVHGHWHYGPVGAVFEYVRSAQEVRLVTGGAVLPEHDALLVAHAWQLVLSVTLAPGDQVTFFGVSPTRPFDPRIDQWGGATVSVRYQELYFEEAAFPVFADPDSSVRAARAIGLSLQWHVNLLLEVQTELEVTVPEGGAPGGDAPTELAWMTRVEGRY